MTDEHLCSAQRQLTRYVVRQCSFLGSLVASDIVLQKAEKSGTPTKVFSGWNRPPTHLLASGPDLNVPSPPPHMLRDASVLDSGLAAHKLVCINPATRRTLGSCPNTSELTGVTRPALLVSD